jgi:hypothetical protein
MKVDPSTFENTPAFQHFKDAMRGVLSVSKEEMERRVHAASESSPRKGNPDAPGRKRAVKRISKKPHK